MTPLKCANNGTEKIEERGIECENRAIETITSEEEREQSLER